MTSLQRWTQTVAGVGFKRRETPWATTGSVTLWIGVPLSPSVFLERFQAGPGFLFLEIGSAGQESKGSRAGSRVRNSRLWRQAAFRSGAAVKSSVKMDDEDTTQRVARGSVSVVTYSQRSRPLVSVSAWTGTGTTFAVSTKYELRAVHSARSCVIRMV